MSCYVNVGEDPDSDLTIEVPSERNGTLNLKSLQAQFPGSTGLRFKSSETGAWRGCALTNNLFSPPEDGWGERTYYVVNTNKPKPKRSATVTADGGSATGGGPSNKMSRVEEEETQTGQYHHIAEIMVADLPYSATEEDIRTYFSGFGTLHSMEMKLDSEGRMKGFGFIKYMTPKDTRRALSQPHVIHDRLIEMKVTNDSLKMIALGYGLDCIPKDHVPINIFVGSVPKDTTQEEIGIVFQKYGPLKGIFVPPNRTGFAFVKFGSVINSFRAVLDHHSLNGHMLNVTNAGSINTNETQLHRSPGLSTLEEVRIYLGPDADPQRRHPATRLTLFLMEESLKLSAEKKHLSVTERYREQTQATAERLRLPDNIKGTDIRQYQSNFLNPEDFLKHEMRMRQLQSYNTTGTYNTDSGMG